MVANSDKQFGRAYVLCTDGKERQSYTVREKPEIYCSECKNLLEAGERYTRRTTFHNKKPYAVRPVCRSCAPFTDVIHGEEPHIYQVAAMTHQILYQQVIVKSPVPLSEEEIAERVFDLASSDLWVPGPRDKNLEIDDITILTGEMKESDQ